MAAMSSLRVVASSPSTRRFFYIGGLVATPSLRVVAAALPALPHAQRLLYAGEVRALSPLRFVAPASPAVARPRRLSTIVLPYMAIWALSSVTTKRPVIHALAVLLLSGLKSTGFKEFVDWAATTFQLSDKFKVAILLGATAITVLFDVAVMGKDLNDVCSYMMTHRRKVQEADQDKSVSCAPE